MDLVKTLKALSNEKRLKILHWLKEPKQHFTNQHCDVEKNGVCVGIIESKIGLSQSTVSEYLNILLEAELITTERKGQWTYCKRNEKAIRSLIKQLESL